MAAPPCSRYSMIVREFDSLSSSDIEDPDSVPILEREDYYDYDHYTRASTPMSSASSASSDSGDFLNSVTSLSSEDPKYYTDESEIYEIDSDSSLSSTCHVISSYSSSFPPNPPPSIRSLQIFDDPSLSDGTPAQFIITEADFKKLQQWVWKNPNYEPERKDKRRKSSLKKATSSVHRKLEKAVAEVFRRAS